LLNPIEYLKGVGPQKADLLKKELNIFTFRDLLEHFPYRHIDKTRVNLISDINPSTDHIQVAGRLISVEMMGESKGKRLVGKLRDASGTLELVWFQGINYIQKMLAAGQVYLVYGRVSFFQGQPQITHPEIELYASEKEEKNFLEPVYPSTEKLKARGLGGRQIGKLMQNLFLVLNEKELPENLPDEIIGLLKLMPRYNAYAHLHFPPVPEAYEKALNRLKF
jgi:ATP-dependent DNA helicase RecG